MIELLCPALLTVLLGAVVDSGNAAPPTAEVAVGALLERRGQAFVAAMNAAGEEPLRAFVRDHLESRLTAAGLAPRLVERLVEHRRQLGPFDRSLPQVLADGRLLFVAVRSAKNGAWHNFQFRVDAADDHRLQLVFVAQAVEPLERPSTPLGAPETTAWLERFLAALDRQQPFSGVALVVAGDRELWSAARGVAAVEPRRAMTRQTRLGMASGSKLFTAVAVLQLVEAGRLSLDTRVIDVLPELEPKEWASQVTIRHLLTHTGGAGDYWDEDYERAWGTITETRQMLPHVARHLASTPVGTFSYSNSGYLLLGLVIEKVSGRSFYDYVAERVFAPSGMTATGYPLRSRREPDVAEPYRAAYDAGLVQPGVYLPAVLGERGTAAGGASSTVDDLVAFVRALAGGKLLRPETFALMTSPQVSQGERGLDWGLGPSVEARQGVTSWGHGGTARGTQFELRVYPALGVVSVVMSNYDTIGGHELAKTLDDIVRNAGVAGVGPRD